MKILYSNNFVFAISACWLVAKNQLVGISFLGYIRYEALAKHIKPFFEKHKSERTSVPRLLQNRINKCFIYS